jgi:DNA-binding NarL/FixJ family response regulator
MTIVVEPVRPNEWRGWAFHRARMDFTDNEIELAASIQPVLIAFNRLTSLTRTSAPRDHRRLSAREAEILQLVAQGFSAADIAGMLRISPLTARKHLEHVYEKLGEHNRIPAVQAGIRDGIIAG